MNRAHGRPRAWKWLARGALAALVLPAAIITAPGAALAEAPAAEFASSESSSASQVTGGELHWGVRSTIRNYLENFGHTEGWVAAYQGARYAKGSAAAVFPAASGTVDPANGTASVSFTGQLEMFGFGEDWLYFENVRLEAANGSASLIVDLLESYNVKTKTEDLTLATFALPEDALTIDDTGTLSLTTGRGVFPEEVALHHLPSYGGPTYGAPNDWTDPMTLTLTLDQGDGGTPGGPGEGEGVGTGPYGVSAGSPYADTSATIRVTPGYALRADGTTEVKVEGFGFDPGSATVPGTGSGGIYVGFGTMKDPSDPEKWRRSKGGSSGPVGFGDFTYGIPMFVANRHSADGDVANAMMDDNGYWTFTIEIPGTQVQSFFGDTIDCLASQCGFFSFGAHGAIKAMNEAFVPVHFVGQDDSGWPERDDDDPPVVVEPAPERPSSDPALPAEASLTDSARGEVQVLSTSNRTATVHVGASFQRSWVGIGVYSEPEFIDWFLVPSNGRISVPLPAGLPDGDHRIVAVQPDSALIGWAPFALGQAKPEEPNPGTPQKGQPNGTSTGRNAASGAELTVTPAKSLADRDQKVTLTGKGYPRSNAGNVFGGVYILFGWVDKMPSVPGASAVSDYVYADGQETYQWMVNYPGNTTEPNAPMMDANGNWSADFTVYGSKFTSANGVTIDCYQVQCGVFTIGAHGRVNAAAEVFTPVYFDDNTDIDPNARPVIDGPGPVQANPNALNSGLKVNGGLAALATGPSEARLTLIAGLLLLSIGALGAALLRSRRTPTTDSGASSHAAHPA